MAETYSSYLSALDDAWESELARRKDASEAAGQRSVAALLGASPSLRHRALDALFEAARKSAGQNGTLDMEARFGGALSERMADPLRREAESILADYASDLTATLGLRADWQRRHGSPEIFDGDAQALVGSVAKQIGPVSRTCAEFLAPRTGELCRCQDLRSWFLRKDAEILAYGQEMPACWGGQFRVGEIARNYVSEGDMQKALPSDKELNLWYAMCDCSLFGGRHGIAEIAQHRDDAEWLAGRASELCERVDAAVYYTEVFPNDYDAAELAELSRGRPDLFTEEDLFDFPELGRVASAGGEDALRENDGRACVARAHEKPAQRNADATLAASAASGAPGTVTQGHAPERAR